MAQMNEAESLSLSHCGNNQITNCYGLWLLNSSVLGPITQTNAAIPAQNTYYADVLQYFVPRNIYTVNGTIVLTDNIAEWWIKCMEKPSFNQSQHISP